MATAETIASPSVSCAVRARPSLLMQKPEGERPEQVELLLDRERPQVLQQRRALERLEVGLLREDLVPVVDVEERGDRVAARPHGVRGQEDRRHERGDGDDQERGRQQAARAPEPELEQVDAAGGRALGDQQRRDQEAAEHEEHVDAEEPARRDRHAAVVEQHRADRDRADTVEGGDVRQSAVLLTAGSAGGRGGLRGVHRGVARLGRNAFRVVRAEDASRAPGFTQTLQTTDVPELWWRRTGADAQGRHPLARVRALPRRRARCRGRAAGARAGTAGAERRRP